MQSLLKCVKKGATESSRVSTLAWHLTAIYYARQALSPTGHGWLSLQTVKRAKEIAQGSGKCTEQFKAVQSQHHMALSHHQRVYSPGHPRHSITLILAHFHQTWLVQCGCEWSLGPLNSTQKVKYSKICSYIVNQSKNKPLPDKELFVKSLCLKNWLTYNEFMKNSLITIDSSSMNL